MVPMVTEVSTTLDGDPPTTGEVVFGAKPRDTVPKTRWGTRDKDPE